MANTKDSSKGGEGSWKENGLYSLEIMLQEIERDRENIGSGGGSLMDQSRIQSLFEEARGHGGPRSR